MAVILNGRPLGHSAGDDVLMSIGAMVFSVMGSTIGPMLKNADDLMYEVKKHGKNNMKVVEQGSGL